LKSYISQGSVATQLRCGGISSNHPTVVTTLLQIFHRMCWWQNFWKSVNIWWWYGQKFVAYFFGHPVYRVGQIKWHHFAFLLV